jgi:hypothetical protein
LFWFGDERWSKIEHIYRPTNLCWSQGMAGSRSIKIRWACEAGLPGNMVLVGGRL